MKYKTFGVSFKWNYWPVVTWILCCWKDDLAHIFRSFLGPELWLPANPSLWDPHWAPGPLVPCTRWPQDSKPRPSQVHTTVHKLEMCPSPRQRIFWGLQLASVSEQFNSTFCVNNHRWCPRSGRGLFWRTFIYKDALWAGFGLECYLLIPVLDCDCCF